MARLGAYKRPNARKSLSPFPVGTRTIRGNLPRKLQLNPIRWARPKFYTHSRFQILANTDDAGSRYYMTADVREQHTSSISWYIRMVCRVVRWMPVMYA